MPTARITISQSVRRVRIRLSQSVRRVFTGIGVMKVILSTHSRHRESSGSGVSRRVLPTSDAGAPCVPPARSFPGQYHTPTPVAGVDRGSAPAGDDASGEAADHTRASLVLSAAR